MHANISHIALELCMYSSQIAQVKCYRVIKLSRVHETRKVNSIADILLHCHDSNSAVSLNEAGLL